MLLRFGTSVANKFEREKSGKVEVDLMKFEFSFLATLFLIGTDLLARAAVHGVEQALIATTIHYGRSAVKKGIRQLPLVVKLYR